MTVVSKSSFSVQLC